MNSRCLMVFTKLQLSRIQCVSINKSFYNMSPDDVQTDLVFYTDNTLT